ncbi:MAG: hypothetical protein O3B45_03060 [Bacteroidetes bacterium]|nr:hypothetical protein [Bacteroidota bacterium]
MVMSSFKASALKMPLAIKASMLGVLAASKASGRTPSMPIS